MVTRIFNPEKIREIRKERKLTTLQLATLSGISRVSLTEIELGKRTPKATTIAKLSTALNVKEDIFLAIMESKHYKIVTEEANKYPKKHLKNKNLDAK